MAVAKRQGRGKPAKIEQRKVEDQSEDLRRDKQHSWLAQFTQGRPRGEEETYKKRSQRAGGLSLSRARAHSLSFSLFASFGLARPHTSRMYFPLFSK